MHVIKGARRRSATGSRGMYVWRPAASETSTFAAVGCRVRKAEGGSEACTVVVKPHVSVRVVLVDRCTPLKRTSFVVPAHDFRRVKRGRTDPCLVHMVVGARSESVTVTAPDVVGANALHAVLLAVLDAASEEDAHASMDALVARVASADDHMRHEGASVCSDRCTDPLVGSKRTRVVPAWEAALRRVGDMAAAGRPMLW